MMHRDLVMTFHSTHQAILAEKLVAEIAVTYDLIPTPRSISAGCGLSLELASVQAEQWLTYFRAKEVIWGGIYLRNIDNSGFTPWSLANAEF